MTSVLVVGRIRGCRRAEVDALLADHDLGWRPFRTAETVALLVDGPRAEARFLRQLAQPESTLARLVACLEDVPLVSREVTPTAA